MPTTRHRLPTGMPSLQPSFTRSLVGLLLLALPPRATPAQGLPHADPRHPSELTTTDVVVGGAKIQVQGNPGAFVRPWSVFRGWIAHSATVVSHYYGRFPVADLAVIIVPVAGRGVKSGNAMVLHKPHINIAVGRETKASDLEADWILIHEMIHLAFPSVTARHHWIEEGLATYVESVARAHSGDLEAEFVWRGFVKGMPFGLPQPGDAGLDYTPTWGRTYWGGALFCLLADIAIREQTSGRYSLQDSLRAIVVAGLSIEDRMSLTEALQLGDQATGVSVLADLYRQMGTAPGAVDLDTLWRRLGVTVQNDVAVFDDSAPLADIRRRITAAFPRVAH